MICFWGTFFQAVNHSAKKKALELKTASGDSVTLDLILMIKLPWAEGTRIFFHSQGVGGDAPEGACFWQCL